MSDKWYVRRWKARLGDVPPGRAFWLAGREYARFGFDARIERGSEVNGWRWDTGKLVYLNENMEVFWFSDGTARDEWRLAAYMMTRVVHGIKHHAVDNDVPASLQEVYKRMAPLLDGQEVIGWRIWIRDVLSSPRDFLKA